MAPTAATTASGSSTEFTTAVRLRSSSLVSAAARASTRRRALPPEPRWGGDVCSTAERVVVMARVPSVIGRSGGGGDGAVGDGEEGLFEGRGSGLQARQLEAVLARPGQQLGERGLQREGAQLDLRRRVLDPHAGEPWQRRGALAAR